MNHSWQWGAYGKHPVAKDYFKLGKEFPLGKGFSDWVEKGYQIITSRKDIRPASLPGASGPEEPGEMPLPAGWLGIAAIQSVDPIPF